MGNLKAKHTNKQIKTDWKEIKEMVSRKEGAEEWVKGERKYSQQYCYKVPRLQMITRIRKVNTG